MRYLILVLAFAGLVGCKGSTVTYDQVHPVNSESSYGSGE